MDNICIKIIIFPMAVDLNKEENYDEKIFGTEFSDLDDIRVNQVIGGYSILYNDKLFPQLDTKSFADNILGLFISQIPDGNLTVELYYFHMGDFSEECGKALIELDEYIGDSDFDFDPNERIYYHTTSNMTNILYAYDEDTDTFDFSEEVDDGEICCNDYPDCDCDDDDDDIEQAFERHLKDTDGLPKKSKKVYGRSRLMKTTKNAKRDIKRHNFLISSDKKAKKYDEKIIKAFLKDFIPGDEKWIKSYRATLLERFMTMFVMSKKMAKAMKNSHKKKSGNNRKLNKNDAVQFTKQLFNGYDPFYDPNR